MAPAPVAPAAIEFGRFRVLPNGRELLADNRPVELGARAFAVLMALIEARGHVVTKDELIERVWPGRIVEENNLQVQISALRKALEADRGLVRTVSGRGYRFAGEIRTVLPSPDAEPTAETPDAAPVLSRPPTNLPEPVSELIGRDAELTDILDLSASHRLVTLTGAGGIGKTRLGFEVARQQLSRFADGVWAIELAPLSDPSLVPVTVAAALGLELASDTASLQSVANALRSKQIMIVLDNCEHVIDAAARLADALLRVSPAMCVIATSREPLRAEGESVYRVPPLAVPPEDSPDSEDPLRYGAVGLFVERARAAAPLFAFDPSIATRIAGICRRLDGIPLAIELAAARAATLGIETLAARLDDCFRLLTGGRRTALPRQQTLRATLDWSHDLLSKSERVILRRLAVFTGAFSVEAANAVAANAELARFEIVEGLSNLVSKSLVLAEVKGPVARYRLLDTMRTYALEKLKDSGEHERLLRHHAEYYQHLFERAEVERETRPTAEWLDDYAWCIDNLRAALDWAFSSSGDASVGVALTAAAVPWWIDLSLFDECRGRAEQALAVCDRGEGGDPRREMKLCDALATSYLWGSAGVHAQVVSHELSALWTKTLKISESLGDADYELRALWGLFACHNGGSGQCHVALEMAQRFRMLAAQQGRRVDELIGHRMIGFVQHLLGDQASARQHTELMLANFRLPHHRSHEAIRFQLDQRVAARTVLARVLWSQGYPDEAVRTAKGAVNEARQINQALSLCFALGIAAGPVMLWVGDLAAAEHYIAMLLDHSARHGLPSWGALGRTYQGVLATRRGGSGFELGQLHGDLDESGGSITSVMFLNALPVDFARTGKVAGGLAAAAQAMERAERTGTGCLFPELLRIRGELLLLQAETGAVAAAEHHFQQALGWADRQGALSLELRAATSLARLWRDQARREEAHELLAKVYARFTEGFATADLKEAKRLLEELA
jgi:predicted ATPase/DNA-binding winged helix-turn-helix (wHTH) protein